MKTEKCIECQKRFKVQDWKVDKERTTCFTCLFIESVISSTREALNIVLKERNKPGRIEVIWMDKPIE